MSLNEIMFIAQFIGPPEKEKDENKGW